MVIGIPVEPEEDGLVVSSGLLDDVDEELV